NRKASRYVESDPDHRLLERLAPFGLCDHVFLGADQFAAQLLEDPAASQVHRTLSPVWPPSVGNSASGRSFSMIFCTYSHVMGSTYVRSAISGSVMMVAGFELTSTTSKPSSRSALHACVPE